MRLAPVITVALAAAIPDPLEGQETRGRSGAADSVVVQAYPGYAAGSLHRFFLGSNYRDLWTMPIKVPVLDLKSYAGGLKALKTGGGKQTVTLRLAAADGSEYVFRPVYKKGIDIPDEFRNTIILDATMDARSASHPTAPLASSPVLAAASVLHPTPELFVMPDDPALGEFRAEFGNVLGTLEEYPDAGENMPGFAGATKVVDSDELLEMINKDANNRVDAHALLTAVLVDMLLNDNDRHAGQWKWARLSSSDAWIPIARDRDKVFLSYEGFLLKLARMGVGSLVTYDTIIPPGKALFDNAIEFERRLLSGLERQAWDSTARALVAALKDSVLEQSANAMPAKYAAARPDILTKLRARRNHLPDAAREYYAFLANVVDVHATDADDRATINRSGEGIVHVQIQTGSGDPWYSRRFDMRETREIRVYLHNGDDAATVTGRAAASIPVRVIGGNGNNTLTDSSTVGGRANSARLYEIGHVSGVEYEPDSVTKKKAETDEGELPFDRRPWIQPYNKVIPPIRDYGTKFTPIVGIRAEHALGLVPSIGVSRIKYGFRKYPYASKFVAKASYSPTTNRLETVLSFDKRFESSPFHVTSVAAMSQFGVVEFRGFGNNVPDWTGDFYDVRMREWSFNPALALSLGERSEIAVGPVLRYTTTDSAANRFISIATPYGFDSFGQAGVRLSITHDTRETDRGRSRGGMYFPTPVYKPVAGTLQLSASAYPAVLDAEEAYGDVDGVAAAYLTIPVGTRPVIALRAGGRKLFGDFPYFDAAFIGGSKSLRTEYRQRYAGDASVFGTAELRVPVAKFPFILPLDVGVLGFADAARVYFKGESPGGWHSALGGGVWVGVVNPETSITVMLTNDRDRKVLVGMGLAF